MSKHKLYQYTEADVLRYHQGKMSSTEMHQIELAALDDPMLADAIEGYELDDNAAENLKKLEGRFNARTTRGKVVPIKPIKWIMAVAAMLLLVLSGYILNRQFFKEDRTLAKEVAPQLKPTDQPIAQPSDTTVNFTPTTEPLNYLPPQKEAAQIEKKSNVTVDKIFAPTNVAPAQPVDMTSATAKMNSVDTVQPSLVAEVASNPALETRGYGNSISRNDDTTNVQRLGKVVAAKSEAKEEQTPESIAENALQSDKLKKHKPNIEVIYYRGEMPLEGINTFNSYLKNNLSMYILPGTNFERGIVRLQFNTNEAGTPVQIQLLRSLTPNTNEASIKMLEDGPKWTPNRKNLEVSFRYY